MKNPIKKLFVILAIVMSFVVVQSVCAETVTGKITTISDEDCSIVVENVTEVYGLKFDYLTYKEGIVLTVVPATYVSLEYFVWESPGDEIKNKACQITVVDDLGIPISNTIVLRPCK